MEFNDKTADSASALRKLTAGVKWLAVIALSAVVISVSASMRGSKSELRDLTNQAQVDQAEIERLRAENKTLLADRNFHRRKTDALGAEVQTLREDNLRLKQLAATDSLTGLFSRVAFDAEMRQEFELAVRSGHPLSLLFLDANNFKEFNDELGHATGDLVLSFIGQGTRKYCRASDIPCRYGGDEFAIILPNTDETGALILKERLHEHVRWNGGSENLTMTLSIGIATYSELCRFASVEEMLAAADADQYLHKEELTRLGIRKER